MEIELQSVIEGPFLHFEYDSVKPAALSICSFAFACLLMTAPLRGDDWYRWLGPDLDGVSKETRWRRDWQEHPPTIAWRGSVGTGFSSVVTSDARVFTTGHVEGQDVVTSFRIDDGEVLWRFAYEAILDARDFEGGPTSTPTVDDGHLYVLSRGGDLFCLDAASGKKIWHTQLVDQTNVRLPGWGLSASPLVVGDRLLINYGESGVAINKHDGSVMWASNDRECGYATAKPIPGVDPAAALFASGRAYIAVRIETGETLWSERWLTSFNCNAADPIFHDGKLFVSSGYNRGSALFDLSTGDAELVWKSKEMKNQIHGSLLHNGNLYGIDGDMEAGARLVCMRWDTGAVVWTQDELRPGGLAMADGQLLLLTESGQLVLAPATANGWQPTAQIKVLDGKCWTRPVLSDGRIFCRSIEGQVVCVDYRD